MTTVRRSAWLIVCGCLAWAGPASADPVVDWNATTLQAVTIPSSWAFKAPRVMPGWRPTSSAVTTSVLNGSGWERGPRPAPVRRILPRMPAGRGGGGGASPDRG